MGILSSESRSREDVYTQNIGFSDVSGSAVNYGIKTGKKSTVVVQDQGALKLAGDAISQSLQAVHDAGDLTKGAVSSAIDAVSASQRTDAANLVDQFKPILLVALVVWGVVSYARAH